MKKHSFKNHAYTDLFFDLDRTLWDFERNSRETFMELYHKYQLTQQYGSFDLFYSTYREYNKELWMLYRSEKITKDELSWKRFDLTLKDIDIDDEKLARNLSKDYLTISPTKQKVFPHTFLSLTFLNKQYNLNLITNGFKEVQLKKLENCGLTHFFKHIFISEEIGYLKPHVKFFEHVLKVTGANPKNSIVIGDDLMVDIKGAAEAGMDSIWINHQKLDLDELDLDFSPTHEVASLKNLIHIL
ncbi:MAG: YjjG family noncanonical pyrimidine nucleotidase [Bacteroidota bacterium]|nr:YjjG family noncanonical pyrimidine nucleotidase [Bacteroidota bacterium]